MQEDWWNPIPAIVLRQLLAEFAAQQRPWPEAAAYLSVQCDYRKKKKVSISGYSALWGWSRGKVERYLGRIGIAIQYPEDTTKRQNQRGQITIRSRTDDEQIIIIDFDKLSEQKNRSRADAVEIPISTINKEIKKRKKYISSSAPPEKARMAEYRAIISRRPGYEALASNHAWPGETWEDLQARLTRELSKTEKTQ